MMFNDVDNRVFKELISEFKGKMKISSKILNAEVQMCRSELIDLNLILIFFLGQMRVGGQN